MALRAYVFSGDGGIGRTTGVGDGTGGAALGRGAPLGETGVARAGAGVVDERGPGAGVGAAGVGWTGVGRAGEDVAADESPRDDGAGVEDGGADGRDANGFGAEGAGAVPDGAGLAGVTEEIGFAGADARAAVAEGAGAGAVGVGVKRTGEAGAVGGLVGNGLGAGGVAGNGLGGGGVAGLAGAAIAPAGVWACRHAPKREAGFGGSSPGRSRPAGLRRQIALPVIWVPPIHRSIRFSTAWSKRPASASRPFSMMRRRLPAKAL